MNHLCRSVPNPSQTTLLTVKVGWIFPAGSAWGREKILYLCGQIIQKVHRVHNREKITLKLAKLSYFAIWKVGTGHHSKMKGEKSDGKLKMMTPKLSEK